MSDGNGDRSSGGGAEEAEVDGEKLRKDRKISYSREFLLSISELEVCKELPSGVDRSILSELKECCQQSSTISSRGVLGDFSKPILRGSNAASNRDSDSTKYSRSHSWTNRWQNGILGSCSVAEASGVRTDTAAASKNHQTNNLLSRSSQPYRPPSFYKAANYSQRESNDAFNDETFGSLAKPGPERLLEEKRRKAAFELTKKWEKKKVQGNEQPLADDQKENFDPDNCSFTSATSLESHSLNGTELMDKAITSATSESGLVRGFTSEILEDKLVSKPSIDSLKPQAHADSKADYTSSECDGLKGKDSHEDSCTQLYHAQETDAENANKKGTLVSATDEFSGDPSGVANATCQAYKSPESCEYQGEKGIEIEPRKPPEDSTRSTSGQNHSALPLEELSDAASEVWNLPSSFKAMDISRNDAKASKFAHLFTDCDKMVNDTSLSYGNKDTNQVSNASCSMLLEQDLQSLAAKSQSTSKLSISTSGASAEDLSKLCCDGIRVGSMYPTKEGSHPAVKGQKISEGLHHAVKGQKTSEGLHPIVKGQRTYKEVVQQSHNIDVNASKHILTMSQMEGSMKDTSMSKAITGFPTEVYGESGTNLFMGQISSKSSSCQWNSSNGPYHGRHFVKELHLRDASVSSLKESSSNLKQAKPSELCMDHATQFKPQISHLRDFHSQPVKPSKLGTRMQVSAGSKFKPLYHYVKKADSGSTVQLPKEDSLITVDDTVIFQPPIPALSRNPSNKPIGRGDLHQSLNLQQSYPRNDRSLVLSNDTLQSPATILPHPLQQSDTWLQQQLPDFPAQRMQRDGYLPAYMFNDPAPEFAVYDCCNRMPHYAQFPDFAQSYPLSYQQNLNPNMGFAIPGCASGGNQIGFSRLMEMEMRLKELMNHDTRARYQRELNERSLYRY